MNLGGAVRLNFSQYPFALGDDGFTPIFSALNGGLKLGFNLPSG
jgi:hypothetical protein